MVFMAIGGTDHIMNFGDLLGTLGDIMIGTDLIFMVDITTAGLTIILMAITTMATLITMGVIMAIMAIMFTAGEEFPIVLPDEAAYQQTTTEQLQ